MLVQPERQLKGAVPCLLQHICRQSHLGGDTIPTVNLCKGSRRQCRCFDSLPACWRCGRPKPAGSARCWGRARPRTRLKTPRPPSPPVVQTHTMLQQDGTMQAYGFVILTPALAHQLLQNPRPPSPPAWRHRLRQRLDGIMAGCGCYVDTGARPPTPPKAPSLSSASMRVQTHMMLH